MRAEHIRQSFVDYFVAKGHTKVPSASLVPADDPTLLFTNAGMVQFKRVFQGVEDRGFQRAVTVQKCVRAGGKHNDLEQVGHTARHHTFFEMLGNFSFGDYFKRGAIEYAWEWVTSEAYLGVHPDRLYCTVHHSDDEAARLWHDVTGLGHERIYRLGDADNFWQMGDTGPCGPCSEIYVDLRPTWKSGASRLEQAEFERLAEDGSLLEIWNLVFMQFDQARDGTRSPLPAPSVDTGAGLERIAAVLQDVPSNFDTDLFRGLIARAADVLDRPYDPGPAGASFRVLADHARAVAFLLADGVYPSNEGRGYVLRRILRRAVRHAYLLGRVQPTLVHLVETVANEMASVYPELDRRRTHVQDVTRAEEERFLDTIEGGLKKLDELTVHGSGVIGGEDAFKLFDTFGFPIDLTAIIAQERGWRVDLAGFEQALQRQRARSRAVAEGAGSEISFAVSVKGPAEAWTTVTPRKRQRFIGYEATDAETDILKFRQHGDRLDVMLHETPFYLESGGQVSDTGALQGDGWHLVVDDVIKVDGKQAVTGQWEGRFDATPVHAVVDEPRRRDIERNHTATHLVHAALRRILGAHVRQRGSVVDPDRLRFDFSHHHPVSADDLRVIEEAVNRDVWTNADIETYEMPYRDAVAKGAMALFGEKYGDVVRVVEVPEVSIELCGGTHVRTTGQIGLFRFVGESGVAANVRRIEAVTGRAAYGLLRQLEDRVSAATEVLRTTPEHLARKVESLVHDNKRLEKQVGDLLRSGGGADQGFAEHRVGDVSVYIGESSLSDRGQIGALMDAFRERRRNAIATLFVTGERPGMHVSVTDDLVARGVQAGELVNRIAAVCGGRGGGRPHFASAGIGDATRLDEAKQRTLEIIETLVAEA